MVKGVAASAVSTLIIGKSSSSFYGITTVSYV